MKNNRLTLTLTAIAFFGTMAVPAHAYIDGGTGSMILQAAVSGVLGALFVARSVWSSLPSKLRKKRVESIREPQKAKA